MSKSLELYAGGALGAVVMFVAATNFADRNVAPMPRDARVMAPLPKPDPAPAPTLIAAAQADEGTGARFGLGRAALPEEVAAWDLDIRPDGTGLPEGSGDVWTGEEVFVANCASCHGDFAEGLGNWPKLAGGEGTLADEDPLKTVGSYWPYLSTVWDYVNRSMPFGNAQSLTPDEVYAITAYILYSNFLVEDDFELSHENFAEFEMPNAGGFILDDRAETEYAAWRAEPCMENCKDAPAQITMRASVLDVTPEEDATDEAAAESPAESPAESGAEPAATPEPPVDVASAEAAPPTEADAEATASAEAPEPDMDTAPDPALVADGERVFRQCQACHQVGDGARNRTGPHLNGIFGREIGALDGFRYSRTMSEMGGVWDMETMAAFLADPRGTVQGTKMAFAGLRKDADIAAVTAYLQSFAE